MGQSVLPLRQDPPVLMAMFASMAVWWGLRIADVIDNWPFVILLMVSFVVATLVSMKRAQPVLDLVAERPKELEWAGVDEPWTSEQVATVERALSLEQVKVDA